MEKLLYNAEHDLFAIAGFLVAVTTKILLQYIMYIKLSQPNMT